MFEAANNVVEFVAGVDFEQFSSNKMLYFAVMKNIEIFGEVEYIFAMVFQCYFHKVKNPHLYFVEVSDFFRDVPQNGTLFVHLCRKVINMDKHTQRIEIFNSTLKLIEQGWYMTPSGEEMELPSMMWTLCESQMYSKPFVVDKPKFKKTTIRVKNMDCVEYVMTLIDRGYNPALLNLAKLYTPGGLVVFGSGAQEENLCRRSNLVVSLYQFSEMRVRQYPSLDLIVSEDQYPMDERYGGIYSGCVGLFHGPESKGYPLLDDPYGIPVISVAAIDGFR